MRAYERRLEMRVALDATPLTLSSGGLRRYTAELSCALAAEFPEDEFLLLSDQPFTFPDSSGHPNLKSSAGPRAGWNRRWWSWGVDREMSRAGMELFHGTDFAVPYQPRRPSVLAIHDLSPWMDAAWHNGAVRVRQRTPVLIKLHIATMVVSFSESVRAQAMDRFGIHASRIVTIPHAASALFRPVKASRTGKPYFLFVGTLEPRKNIPVLADAWRKIGNDHGADLILVGRRRSDCREIPPEPGLKVAGELPDGELPELYSNAAAVVYPSAYEGFGLPVLEAMQCGACVITSEDAALTELTAGAALRVPPGDVRALSAAMEAVIQQPELRAGLRQRALVRARQFSWGYTARRTREVYEEARRRFG